MGVHRYGKEWDAMVSALAEDLPQDRDEMTSWARASIDLFNSAVLLGDEELQQTAEMRFCSVLWKMNGNDYLGCYGGPGSVGDTFNKQFAAAPGDIPAWGQVGEFIVEASGVRALVVVNIGIGVSWLWPDFGYYCIDVDKPFISSSGFRSVFPSVEYGEPVNVVAAKIMALHVNAGMQMIGEPWNRRILDDIARRPWLAGMVGERQAVAAYETKSGQMALAF